jgi:drug/metabolite transporter (DMT)-like permease
MVGPLNSAPLWFLVLLWYGSAALAVTSSRYILRETGLPFCLSAAQYILSTIISYIMLKFILPWLTNGSYKAMIKDYSYDKPEGKLIRSIALTYTLGFVLTNISLSLCNASFSETVKSAEPISSLTLATLTRGEDAVSTFEWLTTLPIVIGVALSSYSEVSFNFLGFLAAATSNFMFSMRGINTKQLRCVFRCYLFLV